MGVGSGPTFFTFHFWIGSSDSDPSLKKRRNNYVDLEAEHE